MTGAEIAAMRAWSGAPDAAVIATMRRQLVDLGDGIAGQLAELERDFTPERSACALRNLYGAQVHIRRLVTLTAQLQEMAP